jgi:hypothetical protein
MVAFCRALAMSAGVSMPGALSTMLSTRLLPKAAFTLD